MRSQHGTQQKTSNLLRLPALLIVGTLAGSPVPARAAEVGGGLIVGAALSSFTFSPGPRIDVVHDVRPSAGGLLAVDLGASTAFETRLVWVRQAVHWSAPIDGTPRTASARVDYLSVPLLLRVSGSLAGARPYALIGGEISFRTAAELVTAGTFTGCPCGQRDFRSLDVALSAGLGIAIPAGPVSVLFEGLYSHGLVDVLDVPLTPGMEEARTRRFVLGTGVRF